MYVPVNVEKYVDTAHTRGADVIQLDLEDSVPASEKDRARTLVEAAAARVKRGGADVIVRINRPLSMTVRDLTIRCETPRATTTDRPSRDVRAIVPSLPSETIVPSAAACAHWTIPA